eukprot:1348131-Rhodomonas_salina.6
MPPPAFTLPALLSQTCLSTSSYTLGPSHTLAGPHSVTGTLGRGGRGGAGEMLVDGPAKGGEGGRRGQGQAGRCLWTRGCALSPSGG